VLASSKKPMIFLIAVGMSWSPNKVSGLKNRLTKSIYDYVTKSVETTDLSSHL